ncbi:MAG: KTSC domain-containing protein [Brevundimonas sp.]
MIELDSSNISGARSDLVVQFKNGAVYRYLNVPLETQSAFFAAESHGKFLNAEIKPHYEFEKLTS